MTATPRAFDEETGTWIWLGRWQRTALPVYPPALILNPDVGFAGESCRSSARLERPELVGRRRRVSGSDAARSNLGRANADRPPKLEVGGRDASWGHPVLRRKQEMRPGRAT